MDSQQASLISRELAEVNRAGQERLGLTVALAAFFAWLEGSDPDNPKLKQDAAEEIQAVARAARAISHKLAARYYNLARAVGTSHAYPDVDHRFSSGQVTLQDLYSAMAESLNEVQEFADLDRPKPAAEGPEVPDEATDDRTLSERLDALERDIIDLFQDTLDPEVLDEVVDIEIPEVDWEWPELDEDEAEQDLLTELIEVEREQEQALAKIKREEKAYNKARKKLEKAQRKAAAKAAGRADLLALEGARALLRDLGQYDRRRVAWMRVTGPTPCAFCAMLASRGAEYKSAQTALFDSYGQLYHPNCHCHVVPVFTDEPYYSARDRFFMDNWEPVTKRFNGKAKLREWRKWLRQQYKSGQVPDQHTFGPAQAA